MNPKRYQKTFTLKEADFQGDLLDEPHMEESGFIAQEVLQIPELAYAVNTSPYDEHKEEEVFYLNYQQVFVHAVAAIQQLDRQVNELRAMQEPVDLRAISFEYRLV